VKWEARLQEFFKLVPIQRVSVPAIAIETNKDNINLERHLKWNLNYVPNKLTIIIGNLNRKKYMFQNNQRAEQTKITISYMFQTNKGAEQQ
jgi:hypothetical protein